MEAYIQQSLSKYHNPDKTKRDILATIQQYKGLVPKLDNFVFNNGTQRELLKLHGTIPVTYKGNTYNIPICVWILDSHPYAAPMCYVMPTPDMQVKVSRHVDHNGKVYLPYLHDWKPDTSDLIGVIQVMIVVFSEQPPVYSKPRQQQGAAAPYPANPVGMPMPSIPGQSQPGSGVGYPNYPQYGATSAASTNSNYGYGPTYAPAPSYPQYPGSTPTYPSYPAAPSGGYGSSAYPSYTPQPLTTQQQPPVGTSNTGTISEEHIKASLLSAVEDKMKRRLREIIAQIQAETDVLRRTQDDLNRGKSRLEDLINKLEQEQLDLDKNIIILKEKNDLMKEIVEKLRSRDDTMDIDEAVVTTAPLYRQLLASFAEENAIEDAIYYLGEALRKGYVDLDVFQKHIRDLSRRQFMLRALMLKCREKARLPC